MSTMSNFHNGFDKLKNCIEFQAISQNLDVLWLYCLFSVECEKDDRVVYFSWSEIKLEKWDILYSQLRYASRFNISIWKINKMVKLLEKIGFGENKNTNKYSIFKLKNDFILMQAWKQNESKLKTKWNTYKVWKYNINKNIYISEIENYFFDKTGFKEEIVNMDPEITFEDFKRSFDNYLSIRDSSLTYYNYTFTLNKFLSSENWYRKFLDAKIEDFLNWKKMGEYEYEKTRKKRAEIKRKEEEAMEETEKEKKRKIEWLESKLETLTEEEKKEIWDEAIKKADGFNIKWERYLRSVFNSIVFDRYWI